MGVSNGFVVPAFRLMHCDTLEVFANRPGGLATAEERRGALGVGLLLRTAVFAHGHSCGCTKAEILAINDDGALADARHEMLDEPAFLSGAGNHATSLQACVSAVPNCGSATVHGCYMRTVLHGSQTT